MDGLKPLIFIVFVGFWGALMTLRRRLFYPLNYGEGHVRDIACSRRDRDGKVDSAQSIANARRAGGANTIRSARSRQKLRLRSCASETRLRNRQPRNLPCPHRTAGIASRRGYRRNACRRGCRRPAGLPLRCRPTRKSGRPSSGIRLLRSCGAREDESR